MTRDYESPGGGFGAVGDRRAMRRSVRASGEGFGDRREATGRGDSEGGPWPCMTPERPMARGDPRGVTPGPWLSVIGLSVGHLWGTRGEWAVGGACQGHWPGAIGEPGSLQCGVIGGQGAMFQSPGAVGHARISVIHRVASPLHRLQAP